MLLKNLFISLIVTPLLSLSKYFFTNSNLDESFFTVTLLVLLTSNYLTKIDLKLPNGIGYFILYGM